MQLTQRIPLTISTKGMAVDAEGDLLLAPGQTVATSYRCAELIDYRYFLRLTGEVGAAWRERSETEQPLIWYRSLEDALDRRETHNDEASLHLRGHGEGFERNAWFKIYGRELPRDKKALSFSVWVRTRELKILPGGNIGAFLEIYLRRKGRHPDDVHDAPDRLLALRAAQGTNEWIELRKRLADLDQVAAILVRVGGVLFSGEAFFSTPCLLVPGVGNLIRPFNIPCPPNDKRNWMGENLSRKEWPEFRVQVNGRKIFHGPAFCPNVRDPDLEFPIPSGALRSGINRLELTLEADYPSAPHYVLRRVEILRETARAFEVVAVPEYGRVGSNVPALIEVNGPGVVLQTSSGGKRRLMKKGLQVLQLDSAEMEAGLEIMNGERSETLRIRRAVVKDDDILLGTSDAIYVPQTKEAFVRYLKWYAAERIGNFVTFRPLYHSCGSRELDTAAWTTAVKLLNGMGLRYALMVDGRELPGKRICPDNHMIDGSGYLGRQSHEADGAFYYWDAWEIISELWMDIFHRGAEPDGIFPGVRPIRRGGRYFPFHATDIASDMKKGADCFMDNLQQLARTATRHTGPSTLFRNFYQAGFQHLGAEQMYGPENVILSALRGASRAYGKRDYGAHLAVQWSSTPLEEPEHFRRYFLSLACCYLQGVSQINTEEGLYRMENLFAREDRFGVACTGHRGVHTDFRRFVETHTRRGTMRVPLAILEGRYCAWTGFARRAAWDQRDFSAMRFGPPEESFDLLKVFYPRCVLDLIIRFPCPHEPQGWYSGAPYGPVDILPVEAPRMVQDQYRVLAFLGWNTFDEQESLQLLQFVKQGGTLLLARPHMSTNIRRFEPSRLPDSPVVRRLLGPAIGARDRVERHVGKGTVIFYGQDAYPAESAVRQEYEQDLRALAARNVKKEQERGWIGGTRDVDFSVYDYGCMRVAYLLNIVWWRQPYAAPAQLLLGDKAFPLKVPFGVIRVITIAGDWAIMPDNFDVDVMAANPNGNGVEFAIQADRPSRFTLFHREQAGRIHVCKNDETVSLRPAGKGVWQFVAPPGSINVSAMR